MHASAILPSPFSHTHIYLPIPVVCDSAPIVALSSKICDGIKRHSFVLIDEHLQLPDTDAQVRLIEPIGNVPSQGPKLPAFLNQRMEKAQRK